MKYDHRRSRYAQAVQSSPTMNTTRSQILVARSADARCFGPQNTNIG